MLVAARVLAAEGRKLTGKLTPSPSPLFREKARSEFGAGWNLLTPSCKRCWFEYFLVCDDFWARKCSYWWGSFFDIMKPSSFLPLVKRKITLTVTSLWRWKRKCHSLIWSRKLAALLLCTWQLNELFLKTVTGMSRLGKAETRDSLKVLLEQFHQMLQLDNIDFFLFHRRFLMRSPCRRLVNPVWTRLMW